MTQAIIGAGVNFFLFPIIKASRESFRALLDRYESAELKDLRRQTISWQKAVSESLSQGDVKSAVQILQDNKRIDWKDTRAA